MSTVKLMQLMEAETIDKPSAVSFRNLGIPGNNVSVRRIHHGDWGNDSFSWRHNDKQIDEHEAKRLLDAYVQDPQIAPDESICTFSNGWTMKREYALVIINNDVGRFAQGKWVMRNENGEAVDLDKFQDNLRDRYPDLTGEVWG